MVDQRTAPYALFLLRIALGGLFLMHFGLKFFVFTPAGTAQFFESLGLPGFSAYLGMGWELIGGVALILGVYARFFAITLIPILLGSIVMVHGAAGFYFDSPNGGWEFPAFWALALLVLALAGDGKFALKPTLSAK
ncbi:DoxX family protein [Marinomonas ostreistagni]|nr:DoxX family protein [Marinomonas ostreistagni]MBM6552100.1 DoxX family protein [Marinomonas ostreistagni]